MYFINKLDIIIKDNQYCMVSSLFYRNSFLLFSFILASCSNINKPAAPLPDRIERKSNDNGKIMGDGFLVFGGPQKTAGENKGEVFSNTNTYLWNASLAVLDFIPLVSADKVGGVIVTDWYQPDNANDRTKLKIQITSPYLEVSALKVSVYKQRFQAGRWIDIIQSDLKIAHDLEMLILTKARELRVLKNSQE